MLALLHRLLQLLLVIAQQRMDFTMRFSVAHSKSSRDTTTRNRRALTSEQLWRTWTTSAAKVISKSRLTTDNGWLGKRIEPSWTLGILNSLPVNTALLEPVTNRHAK
jgi:hypothetical protein